MGARSALFLPFRDLGLVVVDEEHDTSYKQEDGVLYNARDMAVLRASICGAAVVLASATPSLETWANVEAGKYARLDLTARFGEAVMPEMRAIDMRVETLPKDRWISDTLAQAARARLAAGEQALLFLNRRGYAPVTICRACGHQIGCDQCDARMVEHRFRKRAGLPPVRRDAADARRLPVLRGGGQAGGGGAGRGAAGRGGGGAVSRGADRGAVVGPLRVGARAQGRDRGDRGAARPTS